MRISTNSYFDNASARLTQLQAKMDKTAQQVASGRRILSPSDDPVGAALALETSKSASINAQYAQNRVSLRNTLSMVEGSCSGLIDTLSSIHEQVINAGNGVLSDDDRRYIATTMQGQLEQLMALGNSTDGAGHYLFSGHQTLTLPFEVNATGLPQYMGDDGQSMVQVDTARQMPLHYSGRNLFPDSEGQNILVHLQQTIELLKSPQTLASERLQQLDKLGRSYQMTMDSVNVLRSGVGIQLQQLDQLDSLGSARELSLTKTLSEIQDLDYNQALSELTRHQVVLQAAQKTFMQTSNLSLFNYIS